MTLKVSMQHRVLEYFHIYSNDDPELTMTYFTARPNLIPYASVWEKGKIMDFSETFVVCDIKVGIFSLLNEYMNHYEYQRSRSFIELRPRSVRFNIFNPVLLRNRIGRLRPNFKWRLHEMWGMKVCSNVPGHMTMPYKLW